MDNDVITVLLADDHAVVRYGLKAVLQTAPDISVIGEARNGREAVDTAMRRGELMGLTWARVNLQGRYVRLQETKNGSAREVPLSRRAVEVLERMRGVDGARVFTIDGVYLSKRFALICKRIGLSGLCFHDARHEAITRLARKLEIVDLARMVGHKDMRSLSIYYNATASEIARRLD